jgi:hypothetical protein
MHTVRTVVVVGSVYLLPLPTMRFRREGFLSSAAPLKVEEVSSRATYSQAKR